MEAKVGKCETKIQAKIGSKNKEIHKKIGNTNIPKILILKLSAFESINSLTPKNSYFGLDGPYC